MTPCHVETSDGEYHSPCVPRFHRWLLAILVLSAVLRIVWAVLVPVSPISDSTAYDAFARSLVAGNGYGWKDGQPTAFWPVGTSAIYALIYTIAGANYSAIVAFNVSIGVATTWLIALLTGKWFGQSAAILAAAFFAIWPSQIQFTTVLASELLYNVLCLAALAAWYAKSDSRHWVLASGLFLAAASYVRPTALLLPFILSLGDAICYRSQIRQRITKLGIVVLIMAAAILPWSIRNTIIFDKFVLISTNGGANLWMGNNPSGSIEYIPPRTDQFPNTNEAQRNELWKREAWTYIASDPAAFISRACRRLLGVHARETIGVVWNSQGIESSLGERAIMPLKWVATSYWWLMLALAALGVVSLLSSVGILRTVVQPFVILWIYYASVHAVMVSQDRYHFPSIPSIAALAAVGACWTLTKVTGHTKT